MNERDSSKEHIMDLNNIPEVDETAFSQKNDVTAGWHCEAINLRFDIDSLLGVRLQPRNINLDIKVSNATAFVNHNLNKAGIGHLLADDGVFRHDQEVLGGDNVPVAGGSDKDVGTGSSILHCRDLITSHGGLQSVDGINFGNENARAIGLQGLCTLKTRN
jgi:hypothetical protein